MLQTFCFIHVINKVWQNIYVLTLDLGMIMIYPLYVSLLTVISQLQKIIHLSINIIERRGKGDTRLMHSRLEHPNIGKHNILGLR